VFNGHKEGINTCKFLTVKLGKPPESMYVYATGSQDGEIVLWRPGPYNDRSGHVLNRLLLALGPILSIEQVGDSTFCAGTFHGGVAVIDIQRGGEKGIEMAIRHFF